MPSCKVWVRILDGARLPDIWSACETSRLHPPYFLLDLAALSSHFMASYRHRGSHRKLLTSGVPNQTSRPSRCCNTTLTASAGFVILAVSMSTLSTTGSSLQRQQSSYLQRRGDSGPSARTCCIMRRSAGHSACLMRVLAKPKRLNRRTWRGDPEGRPRCRACGFALCPAAPGLCFLTAPSILSHLSIHIRRRGSAQRPARQ